VSIGDSGVVSRLRKRLSISPRWIVPITAVTGSCQASVTPASSISSRPEMISTEEMSRIKRLMSLLSPQRRLGATQGAGPRVRHRAPNRDRLLLGLGLLDRARCDQHEAQRATRDD